MKDFGCIILAAGKGTRFKSDTPKVLHNLHGRPILQNLLDVVNKTGFTRPVVAIGYKAEKVGYFLKDKATVVVQKKQLGTADAVKAGKQHLSGFENIIILYGDVPLIRVETIRSLIKEHKASHASCTLLTVRLDNPYGYGRIIRTLTGEVRGIVEEKEASDEEKKIREVNAGVYCFKRRELFEAIDKVKRSRVKKEYYLTDIVAILIGDGKGVGTVRTEDPDEAIGINSRAELSRAFSILNKRTINNLLEKSVIVLDPLTTFISPEVKIGKETVIYPFVVIERDVKIGRGCSIGPFSRLRSGTVLGDSVEVGNFVEVVRSEIGARTKAKHLTYLGDAVVGSDVNIGCGTITANFDGKKKNRTEIGEKASIGSGTILIAPVKVGKGALTGAGAVVPKRKNVPEKMMALGVPARIFNKPR